MKKFWEATGNHYWVQFPFIIYRASDTPPTQSKYDVFRWINRSFFPLVLSGSPSPPFFSFSSGLGIAVVWLFLRKWLFLNVFFFILLLFLPCRGSSSTPCSSSSSTSSSTSGLVLILALFFLSFQWFHPLYPPLLFFASENSLEVWSHQRDHVSSLHFCVPTFLIFNASSPGGGSVWKD